MHRTKVVIVHFEIHFRTPHILKLQSFSVSCRILDTKKIITSNEILGLRTPLHIFKRLYCAHQQILTPLMEKKRKKPPSLHLHLPLLKLSLKLAKKNLNVHFAQFGQLIVKSFSIFFFKEWLFATQKYKCVVLGPVD